MSIQEKIYARFSTEKGKGQTSILKTIINSMPGIFQDMMQYVPKYHRLAQKINIESCFSIAKKSTNFCHAPWNKARIKEYKIMN